MKKTIAIALAAGAAVMAASDSAWAAGAGGGEPSWSMTLWGFANFGIFCLIIYKFA